MAGKALSKYCSWLFFKM